MESKYCCGLKENDVIVGNLYDKYGSANPIVKRIMSGFERALYDLINQVNPNDIHEIGCGEGYWTIKLSEKGYRMRGTDFSNSVIEIARENANIKSIDLSFDVKSIYDLDASVDRADLIICCEVLEHLDDLPLALKVLKEVADPYLILSVPREPIWSFLNIARGKYIHNLGNTPGHINRWSKGKFIKFISNHFKVLSVKLPIPWTMLLCKV